MTQSRLSGKSIEVLRDALRTERRRLPQRARALRAGAQQLGQSQADESSTGAHQADAASDLTEQEIVLALEVAERERLRPVDQALQRLEDGTFGVCTNCDKPILADRLRALPWTEHCLDCARLKMGAGQQAPR